MKKTIKIVCLDGYTLYPPTDLRWAPFADLGDFEVYSRTAPDQVLARAADADAILTNKVAITAAHIAALPNLKYIGVLATGYNIVDVAAASDAGIVVTNIPSYSTMSVAQHVFALLLAICTGVERYAASTASGGWTSCQDFSYLLADWSELAGRTFGIVGFGNIGQAVARIALAFGMRVAVYTSKTQSELPAGCTKMPMDEVFAQADVLSLHCPLTEDTRHLVNARTLGLMKSGAILINTSRGPVLDEAAVAQALRSGHLSSVGVDVLTTEPPAADNPLLDAPNCYITPHIAWASTQAKQRLADIALQNLAAFLRGNPQNVVR